MSSTIKPPDEGRKALYDRSPCVILKHLRYDGSITAPDKSGTEVLPPSSERAALWERAASVPMRFLFPDGSIYDTEVSGGGGAQQVKYIGDIAGIEITGTSEEFIASLFGKGLAKGDRLFGVVAFSDMPAGLNNAELTFDIFEISDGGYILYAAQLSSIDVQPYLWTAADQYAGPIVWQPRPMSDGSVNLLVSMPYSDFEQLDELEPNAVYHVDGHPDDEEEGGEPRVLENVVNWTDKTITGGGDTATLRFYHSGDRALLDEIDEESLLAFIIIVLISETMRREYTGWTPAQLRDLCKIFHEVRVTGIDINGILSGQHFMANLENLAVSYSDDIEVNNEIVGDYTMPSLGRELQSNTAHLRVYALEDSSMPYEYAVYADVVFGGGAFQSRWTVENLGIDVQPGANIDLFQAMDGNFPSLEERGLLGMSFNIDYETGIVKFPKVQELIPYDIDIRIGGTSGNSGIHAFKINLVRVQDDSVARSYKSLYVDTDVLANESILGLSYTDGIDDPYILHGMRFVLQNSPAGDVLTITDVDITIQGIRS